MVEIVRIQNEQELSGDAHVCPTFEIILNKPREMHAVREILALIEEESERILKTDYGKQFDSVAFSFTELDLASDLLASWIQRNHAVLPGVRWMGKCAPCAAPADSQVDSVEAAVRTDCHHEPRADENTVSLKRIPLDQAEKCAKQLVDIYHARCCLANQDDFEHADALLLKKDSEGRRRTELEKMVLNECEIKIKREVQNLAKRSGACETTLTEVTEKHRRNMVSYVVSPEPYEKWYRDVGSYIEKVAATKIRHLKAHHLNKEEKEAELFPLYPKGWFDRHVFHHLENIDTENVDSSAEDIANVCGRNDRNIDEEIRQRNLHNSHIVAKALTWIENSDKRNQDKIHEIILRHAQEESQYVMALKKEYNKLKKFIEDMQQNHSNSLKEQIHNVELEYLRKENREFYKHKKEIQELEKKIKELEKIIEEMQQNHSGSLNHPQSGHTRTTQEIERPHTVLTTQDPAKTMDFADREKENVNNAQKKGQVTATKRQQDTRHNPKENPYKRCYTNTRKR